MQNTSHDTVNKLFFLSRGGEMGELTRKYDWSEHQLGDPEDWPQSLKITISIILNSKFPMFLWWSDELFCFYNDAYRPSLGNQGKHPSILGLPAKQAWPEIWEIISPLITQVMSGGQGVFFEDMLVPIYRNGKIEDVYWTFSYSPVPDESGSPAGVLVTCTETTEKVMLFNHISESEQRFQNLVRDAKVGIIVLKGKDLIVEVVNDAYGLLIERTGEELIGKPIFDVVPETEEFFRPIIENVRDSGQPQYLNEQSYQVYKDGKIISGFVNVVYQPYREKHRGVAGVMILCQDVTELIDARKTAETALEQVRLSKEAAQLGLFDMDLDKGTMIWDTRCRTLFGISHKNTVTYDHDFVLGLHPDDRERVTKFIDELFINPALQGNYDVEYRTIGEEDNRERWVRAKGKVYFDGQNKPVRFIGSVLDITEQKLDELRKNDFIAMVSHELKTPLTSLTAVIQLLLAKRKNEASDYEINALNTANKQAKKMSTMINGFLNTSRLESGKLIIDKKTFDISDLLSEIVEEMLFTFPNHQISFMPCESIIVNADREKISSVISNLVSNAVKYSPANKVVNIICEPEGGDVRIAVRDYGIGIKEKDIEKLFDRFYRVENENTNNIMGFGIGLYLSAEIIKRHKGKIWAESVPGKGSTFFFTLPV